MVLDCGSTPIDAISSSKAKICFNDSGYLFYLLTIAPSAGQISRMCTSDACLSIYNDIYDVAPTECKIETKTGTLLLYEDFLDPIWDERKPTTTPAPSTPTPTTRTPSPVPTTLVPDGGMTQAPPSVITVTGSSSNKSTTIVAVVVGVVVVLVAVVTAIILVRKNQKKKIKRRSNSVQGGWRRQRCLKRWSKNLSSPALILAWLVHLSRFNL